MVPEVEEEEVTEEEVTEEEVTEEEVTEEDSGLLPIDPSELDTPVNQDPEYVPELPLHEPDISGRPE
jgi:hypothetical protein